MKKLVVGECKAENIFALVDPTGFLESDFEAEVVQAVCCLMPQYHCGVFAGAFLLEGERRFADLALVHKSFSHWFVVEVEIAGHSFEDHVLPQVRCFRYGEPDGTCEASLRRAFPRFSKQHISALLTLIPRFVAVVDNIARPEWSKALTALDVQYITLSVYRSSEGRSAHEINGQLLARCESLGFGRFSATDNSVIFSKTTGLRAGNVEIVDQFGLMTEWAVAESCGALWISKTTGPALISQGAYVQLLRSVDGLLSLRITD